MDLEVVEEECLRFHEPLQSKACFQSYILVSRFQKHVFGHRQRSLERVEKRGKSQSFVGVRRVVHSFHRVCHCHARLEYGLARPALEVLVSH